MSHFSNSLLQLIAPTRCSNRLECTRQTVLPLTAKYLSFRKMLSCCCICLMIHSTMDVNLLDQALVSVIRLRQNTTCMSMPQTYRQTRSLPVLFWFAADRRERRTLSSQLLSIQTKMSGYDLQHDWGPKGSFCRAN